MQCLTTRIKNMIDTAVRQTEQRFYGAMCHYCADETPILGLRYEERVPYQGMHIWGWVHQFEDGNHFMCLAWRLRDALEDEPYGQKTEKSKRVKK